VADEYDYNVRESIRVATPVFAFIGKLPMSFIGRTTQKIDDPLKDQIVEGTCKHFSSFRSPINKPFLERMIYDVQRRQERDQTIGNVINKIATKNHCSPTKKGAIRVKAPRSHAKAEEVFDSLMTS